MWEHRSIQLVLTEAASKLDSRDFAGGQMEWPNQKFLFSSRNASMWLLQARTTCPKLWNLSLTTSSLQVKIKLAIKAFWSGIELSFVIKDVCHSVGNGEEGSRIAQAAARTLTPVTLILGGKNPCYVDQQCDVATAAQRVAWARFHNAGQSLAAPGYILCHADVKARLVQALKCCLSQFYGSDPRESRSYGRMVNPELFNRTRDMLWRSGKVTVGGQVIEAEKYIGKRPVCGILWNKADCLVHQIYRCSIFFSLSEAPTILTEVAEQDPIMQQDFFGPVLPVLTVKDVDEAIDFINKQEKPLCVYAYSSNSKVHEGSE